MCARACEWHRFFYRLGCQPVLQSGNFCLEIQFQGFHDLLFHYLSLGPLLLPPPLILISTECFSPGCEIFETPGASCRLLGANGFGEYVPLPLWHKKALRSLFFEAYHFLVHLLLLWSKPHTFTSRGNLYPRPTPVAAPLLYEIREERLMTVLLCFLIFLCPFLFCTHVP